MNIIKCCRYFLLCLIISSLLIPNISLFICNKRSRIYRDDCFNSLESSADNSSWTYTWNGYGSSWGSGIKTDYLDNVYVAGNTNNYVALLKFNITGNLLWYRTWRDNRTKYCSCKSIEIDNLNNIYLAGDIGLNDDIFLLKYDSFGNKIWNITWGREGKYSCNDIAIDSENNLYVVGSKSIEFKSNTYLAKFNSSGSYLWNFTFGKGVDSEAYAISIDSTGNIFLGGYFDYDPILLKLNSSGSLQWNYTYYYSSIYCDLTIDSSNNILFVDGGGRLFKFNSFGLQLWNRSLNKHSLLWPSIITDSLNNIYIVQNREVKCISKYFFAIPQCICTNIFLMKCDSNGNLLWEKRCTGCSDDRCNDITLDSNENIYLCGTLISKKVVENTILDILIIKNPKEYDGICFIYYYDLFFVIIISAITVFIIKFLILNIRRKKLLKLIINS